MREPPLVRVPQRVEDLGGDADGAIDRQHPLAADHLPQRLTGDKRHHEPEQVVGFAGIEQRRDVRVVERGGVANLAQKPIGGDGDGELGMQHLDRDPAAVHIEGAVERGIAAAPHRGDDVIAIAQRLADPPDQFPSHRGTIGGPGTQKGRVLQFYGAGGTRVQ